jgi:hypothetical protein
MRTVFAFLLVGATMVAPAAIAVYAAQSSPAPMSPEAKAYLDQAITLFREQHINSAKMDWPALTQEAYAAAAGAKTTADTYPAIRLIIKELSEKHTLFVEPDEARADMTGHASGNAKPPPLLVPQAVRLANGIGAIRLYGMMGSVDDAKRYSEVGKNELTALRGQGVCKFILDLRDDTGGNMYPMIDAVSELLGDGVLGTFEDAQGRSSPWLLQNGKTTVGGPVDAPPAASGGAASAWPVAVLIGPKTASAGEYTAMSFEGRRNTRFFGAPSAGYVTANQPVRLSDGAIIAMTGAWGLDRTGKKYIDRITPDEETSAGAATEDAAMKWLMAQPCPAAAPNASSAKRR